MIPKANNEGKTKEGINFMLAYNIITALEEK